MINPHIHSHIREFGLIMHMMQQGSYAFLFLFSIVLSYLIPLPEAAVLVIFGYAGKTAGMDFMSVFIFSLAGIIVGDNIFYRLSFFGNKYVEKFNRKMREHKLIRYENLVKDNIGVTIYFLRFITGIRFFGPVLSGTLGIKWRDFFFFNATASIINTFMFVALGYYLKNNVLITVTTVEIARNLLTFFSVFIAGALLSIFSKKIKAPREGA